MSLDWETHRGVLEDLRLRHSVKEIILIMKEKHQFIATENQYITQFQIWPAASGRKNLNKIEWGYVRKNVEQRDKAGRKSQVFFYDRPIANLKIRKGMSRVPNTYYSGRSPQTPNSIQIHTPPETSVYPSGTGIAQDNRAITQVNRKRAIVSSGEQQISRTKRNSTRVKHHEPATMYNEAIQMITPAMLNVIIDQSNLPYFEFLWLMDALQSSAGSQPLLQGDFLDFSVRKTFSSSNMLYTMDGDESFGLFNNSEALFDGHLSTQRTGTWFYESLARLLVQSTDMNGADDRDQMERHQELVTRLPQMLENMPERVAGENDSNIKTILGPPQLSAGLCLLNIVVYLYSNNLTGSINRYSNDRGGPPDPVLNWIIDRLPFEILAALLQTNLPTLQELQFKLISLGVRTNCQSFVQKLLDLDVGLEDAVRSNALLKIAIRAGATEMVEFLLDAGSDVTHRGDSRWVESLSSPGFSVEIGNMLTGAGADLGASVLSNPPRWDIISAAVAGERAELVRYWIGVGLHVLADDKLLMTAAEIGQLDIVNILLQAGANPQFEDCVNGYSSTWTPLHAAAQADNIEIAKVLLKAGSNINYSVACGGETATCLKVAIWNGYEAMVRFLLKEGADPDARGDSTETPILLAIYHPDPDPRSRIIQVLLEYRADPNISSTKTLFTALDLARSRNLAEVEMQFLLDAGARPNDRQLTAHFYNAHRLAAAIRHGDIHQIEELTINININMNMLDFTYVDGPILGDDDRVRVPARHFLGPHATILRFALAQRHPDHTVFRFLVQKIPDINLQNSYKDMHPILQVATTHCKIEFVKILLDAGAQVNAISYARTKYFVNESTALLGAIRKKDAEIVRLLLDSGADVNLRREGEDTPLQAAIRSEQIELAKYLLSQGADIAAPASEPGRATALQYMSQAGRSDLESVNLENTQMLKTLLLKAVVNEAPSKKGLTALQYAVRRGNMPFTVILLGNGAEIDFVSNGGRFTKTALGAAADAGHVKIAQLLLSRGANLNAPKSIFMHRPLTRAAFQGRLDMVQLLINAGADDDLPEDKRYYAALRCAEMREFLGVVALLRKLIGGIEEALGQRQLFEMLPVQDERKCRSCNGMGCWKHPRNKDKSQVCQNCRGKGRVWDGEDEGDSGYVWDSNRST